MPQYDIEILQTIKAVSSDPVLMSLSAADGKSRAVTGIQKLVQRYLLALLTAEGSVRFDKAFGTTVLQELYSGISRNRASVSNAFNFATADAIDILREEDANTDYGEIPDDERIKSALLTDFSVDTTTSTLYLEIMITSVAGSSYEYKLPLQVIRG